MSRCVKCSCILKDYVFADPECVLIVCLECVNDTMKNKPVYFNKGASVDTQVHCIKCHTPLIVENYHKSNAGYRYCMNCHRQHHKHRDN